VTPVSHPQPSVSGGRMSWAQALAGPLAGATCLWQDLDGVHRAAPPMSAPHTSTVWGWTASGGMVRLRLDGDIAYVATCAAAVTGRRGLKPWSAGDHRVDAIRPPKALDQLESLEEVVVDDVTDGAGPITFIRLGSPGERSPQSNRTNSLCPEARVRGWMAWASRGVGAIAAAPAWLIGVTLTMAVACLGAALGVIPDLAADGHLWPPAGARWPSLTIYGVAGLCTLAVGGLMWRTRNVLMRRRGTAYIIEELDARWTPEEKQSFLADVKRRFASRLDVPPVKEFDPDWDWSRDDRAHRWDERVGDLVRAFWTIRFADDRTTSNAPFVWAHWPVALAFGARAVSGRRGMELKVWQRPSFGRVGTRREVDWRAGPHTFDPTRSLEALSDVAPEVSVTEIARPARIRWESQSAYPIATSRTVEIVVLRMNREPWGPLDLPAACDENERRAVELTVRDSAGLGMPDSLEVTLREWRCLTADGVLPWQAYPALVRAAAARLTSIPMDAGVTTLVGVVAPQEITLGLGIHAGGVASGAWPAHVWPLVHRSGTTFIVPKLDLGWSSLNPSKEV